ncbi:MAG: hypothetical protein H6652_04035 [Ardenticatenaceae bacterium]|nr:hypothetical protein [Ardenticatenaceae bacterium]
MKRKDEPDKPNASRFLEYGSMIMALVSAIWLVVTMTQVTFPGFDARLLPPLLILLIAGAVWGITLVRDEARRLGWPVAIASVIALLLAQLLAFLISRLLS